MGRRRYKYVERLTLDTYRLGDTTVKGLTVFVRTETKAPLLLPLLFAAFVAKNGFTYRQRRSRHKGNTLEPSYLRPYTVRNYLSCLNLFLDALEGFSVQCKHSGPHMPSGDNLHLVDERFLALYMSEYLPQYCGTFRTLQQHQAAIQAFFDWLTFFGFHVGARVPLRRDAQERLVRPTKSKEGVIQYISKVSRKLLLRECRFKRDRLVLRAGFELGLRASENLALVLPDQMIKGKRKPGLLTLFSRARQQGFDQPLDFWLDGRYCKYGKSRQILIPPALLEDFADYYDTERAEACASRKTSTKHLFINYGKLDRLEISPQFPTDLFRSVRRTAPFLDAGLSYHDLRHTFATELYSSLIEDDRGFGQNRALAIVQDRLGHASPSSTTRYVHLFEKMQLIESADREF